MKRGRRRFFKQAAAGIAGASLAPSMPVRAADASRLDVLSALGDALIPSRPGDPGFKDMLPYGIAQEVNKSLVAFKDRDFAAFNQAAADYFQGRTFVELNEAERSQFLDAVVSADGIREAALRQSLQRLYRLVRISILRVYYSNFPENSIPRDSAGLPMLKAADLHQVTTPNTKEVVTAWDQVGYRGPLTWEQESEMRERVQKVHWHDDVEDLIVRYRPKDRNR